MSLLACQQQRLSQTGHKHRCVGRLVSWRLLLIGLVLVGSGSHWALAQSGERATSGAQDEAEKLAGRQQNLAEKYQQLELLMLKMAEFEASSNPQRSALLKQALAKSKEGQISQKLVDLVELLRSEKLKDASSGQQLVRDDIAKILDLLLTENRSDRLRDEQDRVRRYIKEVERVLRLQRSVQGRTEAGDDAERLAQEQSRIADRAGQLNREIETNETMPAEGGSNDSDSGSDQDAAGDSRSSDSAPGDSSGESDDKPSPSETDPDSPGEPSSPATDTDASDPNGQPSGKDESSDDSPAEGQPGQDRQQPGQGQQQGQPGQGQQQGQQGSPQQQPPQDAVPQQFPGQKQIQQAEQKMREAQERLEQAKREGALRPQQQARQLLEQAKAELEDILRQMREEEIERTLARLESRFRKMLEMQIRVFEGTEELAAIPGEDRGGQVVVEAGKLSAEERNILAETDKALLLLREEGSSVAFPEAVEQMQEDIQQVVGRLAQAKIDPLTLGLEEDIITALEEMVEALQKAQQEAEQRRQQGRQQPGQMISPQDMPLVDAIAELKMIRALQVRINRRTQTYAGMLGGPQQEVGQATDEDLIASLKSLAEREERIHQVTRDIVLEKNK